MFIHDQWSLRNSDILEEKAHGWLLCYWMHGCQLCSSSGVLVTLVICFNLAIETRPGGLIPRRHEWQLSFEHVDVNSVHPQMSLSQRNKTRLVHGDAITRTEGQRLGIVLSQALYIQYIEMYILMCITISRGEPATSYRWTASFPQIPHSISKL